MKRFLFLTIMLCSGLIVLPNFAAARQIIVPANSSQAELQAAIDSADPGDHVIIEPGRCIITSALKFKSDVDITGRYSDVTFDATASPSMIVFSNLRKENGELKKDPLKNVTLHGIRFFNIQLKLSGNEHHRIIQNITVRNCRFDRGKAVEGKSAEDTHYISIGYGDGITIEGCKLQRRARYPGKGINLYRAHHVTIQDCHIGSNAYWGHFKTAINVKGSRYDPASRSHHIKYRSHDIVVRRNTIHRNPAASIAEDHGIYAWGMDGLRIELNLISGWTPSASGGAIKVRNGENVEIIDNDLERSGIFMHTYKIKKDKKTGYIDVPQYLKNVLVSGNNITLWQDYDPSRPHYKGIRYYRNTTESVSYHYEENIRIIDNVITNGNIRIVNPIDAAGFNSGCGGVFSNTANQFLIYPDGIYQSHNTIKTR